jgi:hypothetical protein
LLVSDTAIDGMPSDRAGVDRVVAHVRAEVDPGHDDVGQRLEQTGDGEVHAVGRRAVDEQEAVGGTAHRERTVERERVGSAAAVALRRDHRHGAEVGERRGEDREPGGEVAVVVREQDPHEPAAIICQRVGRTAGFPRR